MVSTTSFLNSGVYRLFGTPFGIKITPPVRHYIILSNKWGAVHLRRGGPLFCLLFVRSRGKIMLKAISVKMHSVLLEVQYVYRP